MTVSNRIRHGPSTVLDQVEARNRVWNPTTLDWEVETVNDDTTVHDELVSIRRILEEILVFMKEK